MSDVVDEPVLDLPTKKKKKKSTKVEEVQEAPVEEPEPELALPKKKKKKSSSSKGESADASEESNITKEAAALFDGSSKKKKKPSAVTVDEEQLINELNNMKIDDSLSELIDRLKTKKKKKSKSPKEDDEAESAQPEEEGEVSEGEDDAKGLLDEAGDDEIEFGEEDVGEMAWLGSDRDYKYAELLHRVFGMLRSKNPELSGGRRRYKMKPPQVMKDGTRKTIFGNFAEICKNMNRNPDHVLAFMFAELGTSGSVDGNERLVIKGRFLPKSIETILRRYITEYVVCQMCHSLDTILTRDPNTRLYALQCSSCNATRTVSAIKQGYQAQIGRRRRTE